METKLCVFSLYILIWIKCVSVCYITLLCVHAKYAGKGVQRYISSLLCSYLFSISCFLFSHHASFSVSSHPHICFKFHLTPSVPLTYLMLSVAEDDIDVVIMRSLIIIITEADEAKHGHVGCTYRGVCV